MIAPDAQLEVRWLPTTDLVPRLDESPLDLDQVRRYVAMLDRPDGAHTTLPEVEPLPDGRHLIRNGRHRWVAHLSLGRPRIRCLVVREEAPCPPPAPPTSAGTDTDTSWSGVAGSAGWTAASASSAAQSAASTLATWSTPSAGTSGTPRTDEGGPDPRCPSATAPTAAYEVIARPPGAPLVVRASDTRGSGDR